MLFSPVHGRIFQFCRSGIRQNRKIPPRRDGAGRIFRFCCMGVPHNWKILPRTGITGRISRFCRSGERQNRNILPRAEGLGRILRFCGMRERQNWNILPRGLRRFQQKWRFANNFVDFVRGPRRRARFRGSCLRIAGCDGQRRGNLQTTSPITCSDSKSLHVFAKVV